LRSRLWLVIGVLVLLPLAVGAVVATTVVPELLSKPPKDDLTVAGNAIVAKLQLECEAVGVSARALAVRASSPPPGDAWRQSALRDAVGDTARYAALVDATGRVVEYGDRPAALGMPASAQSCLSPGAAARAVLAQSVQVFDARNRRVFTAVVARAVDAELLRAWLNDDRGRRSAHLIHGEDVIASTNRERDPSALAVASGRTPSGLLSARPTRVQGVPWQGVFLDAAPDAVARIQRAVVATAFTAMLLVVVIGWWIARSLTRPLEEVGDAAARVASGELDLRVPVRTRDEVGRLGERFNDMTEKLQRTIAELERSRDEMSGSLHRLGETLKSTHDLDKLMHLVLETAITMTEAHGGAAYVRDSVGLRLVAERGLGDLGVTGSQQRPLADAGVVAAVLASRAPVRTRLGSGQGELRPAPGEPPAGEVLAMPLGSGDPLAGVLALYRRPGAVAFTGAQEEALRTLAGQAVIAADNVKLHRDAERLSITDPLTGCWNFRYLSMSLAREIERATRFNRPLAVLMLDLDSFKLVNDTYGHARGDAVLREFAARIVEQVREVDTLARYGGEEFVLVLPETTPEGAAMLAERICAAVRRDPFGAGTDEEPLHITVSIGVAAFPRHGGSPATLMHGADEALYVAKRSGRDTWRLASDASGELEPELSAT
jgi:diguanylate cyclase (GGDEF)-like protein